MLLRVHPGHTEADRRDCGKAVLNNELCAEALAKLRSQA
jgi:hypothetical protein